MTSDHPGSQKNRYRHLAYSSKRVLHSDENIALNTWASKQQSTYETETVC